MNEEAYVPPSREEASAALAEVDQVLAQTRHAISRGMSAPLLMLWGGIWIAADVTTQFKPELMSWLWLVLDLVGIGGSIWIARYNMKAVKFRGGWRYGVFWGVLFFYAVLWMNILVSVKWPTTNTEWETFEPVYRRLTAYMHTVPMFAYVVGGLWLDSFFIWLGVIVTILIVADLCFVTEYFYLWLGVSGGGALALSGVFIRKKWK